MQERGINEGRNSRRIPKNCIRSQMGSRFGKTFKHYFRKIKVLNLETTSTMKWGIAVYYILNLIIKIKRIKALFVF